MNSKGLSSIYIRLTINGRRLDQSIGRSINPALWSPEAGRVKGNNDQARQLNNNLDVLRSKVIKLGRDGQKGAPPDRDSRVQKKGLDLPAAKPYQKRRRPGDAIAHAVGIPGRRDVYPK